ncbi:unnamed protein product [Brassica rapa subsp. narinosa]
MSRTSVQVAVTRRSLSSFNHQRAESSSPHQIRILLACLLNLALESL